MSINDFQSLIHESQLDPYAIAYLIREGINVERLRLQFLESSNGNTLNSFEVIMQGERALLLIPDSKLG